MASEAVILLGSGSLDKWLLKLHVARITSRLRCVFKTVAETEEFLAATFELRVGQCLGQLIEILTPLSSNGRHVDTSRPEAQVRREQTCRSYV
jgi:hypothetical protein